MRAAHRSVVLLLSFALALLVVVAGCRRKPRATRVGTTTAPLRDAFNRDVGKARVLMLVSPT